MKKTLTIAVISTVSAFVVGFLAIAIFSLFGNPLDRKNIRNIAEQYVAENYSEMNPAIVDIDYFGTPVEGPYHVEVYLKKLAEHLRCIILNRVILNGIHMIFRYMRRNTAKPTMKIAFMR